MREGNYNKKRKTKKTTENHAARVPSSQWISTRSPLATLASGQLHADFRSTPATVDAAHPVVLLSYATTSFYGATITSSIKQYKIKEINEKRKSEEGSSTSIQNDAVAEVLGSDKKGRVRGMGSHVTKIQVEHLRIANAKEVLFKEERDRLEEFRDDIKAYRAMSAFLAQFKGNDKQSSPQIVVTPRSDLGSNTVQNPPNLGDNVDHVFSLPPPPPVPRMMHNPPVILIDNQGNHLARGYVVTDSTANICHGRKVGIGEKKVHIEEVFEPDAPIWGSRDCDDTLASYASGVT